MRRAQNHTPLPHEQTPTSLPRDHRQDSPRPFGHFFGNFVGHFVGRFGLRGCAQHGAIDEAERPKGDALPTTALRRVHARPPRDNKFAAR
jgi:hypothetical protein